VGKVFIKLRLTMLMASALMLVGCEGKLEPKEVFEVKIDGKIQKLNENEISKFSNYKRSICKVSEYFKNNTNKQILNTSESAKFDGNSPPQEEIIKITASSALEFNIKDFKINTERFLIEQDINVITTKDLNALDDMFMVLDKIKKDWTRADVYLSDTASFENLKNYKEYFFNNMRLERNKVVCESQMATKN